MRIRIFILLAFLGACSGPDDRGTNNSSAGRDSAILTLTPSAGPAQADGCRPANGMISGTGVGAVQLGDSVTSVVAKCGPVRDTALTLEGEIQPAVLIPLGADTVLAEITDSTVWRMRIRSGGLVTHDSIRVGTRARDLATLGELSIAAGEGAYYALSADHCGLSFQLRGLGVRNRGRWTRDDVPALPDTVTVGEILIVGCNKVE